jgi:hypothetical protein
MIETESAIIHRESRNRRCKRCIFFHHQVLQTVAPASRGDNRITAGSGPRVKMTVSSNYLARILLSPAPGHHKADRFRDS